VTATPAFAADPPLALLPPLAAPASTAPQVAIVTPPPVPAWQADFAGRYWFAAAKTGKSLFDVPSQSDAMVSRLTYSGMSAGSGELFGRAALTNGLFVKGYIAAAC